MTDMMKNQGSNPGGGGGTLGMHRDSRVISKVQPPKIRIIHLYPPKIIHAEVDSFRDLVQRLTGKNRGKGGKGKMVKPEEAMIRCDSPTVIIPKVEVDMMGIPGSSSSSSSDHDRHDHDSNNDILYGGEYLSTFEVDDGFDFNSLFNVEGDDASFHHDHHLNLFGETTSFY